MNVRSTKRGVSINKRKEQKEQRRYDILEAALELFIRKGYTATTIKDIASAVGMSVGLMFHYFESKEALLLDLVKLGRSGPNMIFEMGGDLEPIEFFEFAAESVLDYIDTMPFVAKIFVLMKQCYMSDATPETVSEILLYEDTYSLSAEIIKRGQQQGVIREGDPQALSIAFWSAIQGIAETSALSPEYPCPDSEWVVDILRSR